MLKTPTSKPNKTRVDKSIAVEVKGRAAVVARVFKTKWFNANAKSEGITDDTLCEAIEEIMKGQGDDLGGGVWKKRLNKNQHRSIILAKGKKHWIYAFLFAKKDQANIDEGELKSFKKLAKYYSEVTDANIAQMLKDKEFVEICNDCKK